MTLCNDSHVERPQSPQLEFIEVLYCGITVTDTNNSVQYLIRWLPPSNINKFDLNHYELTIGNETIRAKENSVILSIKNKPFVSINAVDRCGNKSISIKIPIPLLSIPAIRTGGLSTNTTSTNTCCRKNVELTVSVVMSSLGLITLVAVIIIIIMLIIFKYSQKRSWPANVSIISSL